MKDFCRLCLEYRPLLNSHVIPKFAFKWLKGSSGGIPIRSTDNPNKRVQDGITMKWLCSNCEQRLSKWERVFCNEIFYPFNNDSTKNIFYDENLLLFSVSLSWRATLLSIEKQGVYWQRDYKEQCIAATERWREFLNGEKRHPSKYEQHIIPIPGIIDHNCEKMPDNINRYLLRSIDLDIAHGERNLFSYVKMGPFIVLGLIEAPTKKKWQGTKVRLSGGKFNSKRYVLPIELSEFIFMKAEKVKKLSSNLSEAQQNKVDENLEKNIDTISESKLFEAIMYDYELFGEDAVIKNT